MACPYFFPNQKTNEVYWPFPHRLPLGAGFSGCCTAGAGQTTPTEVELRELCNIGYARQCQRIPADRHSDAVRFSVARDMGDRILLHYCCERDHAPLEHGQLQYDCRARSWVSSHHDACIQRQAECYLSTYLERHPRSS